MRSFFHRLAALALALFLPQCSSPLLAQVSIPAPTNEVRVDAKGNLIKPVNGLAPYVDSAAYGMVADDGVTDNTAALQSALNAAAASNSRTLLIRASTAASSSLPPHTYGFNSTVTVPAGITILGEASPGDVQG